MYQHKLHKAEKKDAKQQEKTHKLILIYTHTLKLIRKYEKLFTKILTHVAFSGRWNKKIKYYEIQT